VADAVARAADDACVDRVAKSGTAPRAGGSGRVAGPLERWSVAAAGTPPEAELIAVAREPKTVAREPNVAGLAARALSLEVVRWTAAEPPSKPAPKNDPAVACDSDAGAHHGLGSAASPPASSSDSSSDGERWSTKDGRIGLSAAIGRISGATDVWTDAADGVAMGEPDTELEVAGAVPAEVLAEPPAAAGAECDAAGRATGRCGSAASRWMAAVAGAAPATGSVPAIPPRRPAPRPAIGNAAAAAALARASELVDRCPVGSRFEAATGIGPEVVDRLTTGPGGGAAPTGRADAGTAASGAPRPRRGGSVIDGVVRPDAEGSVGVLAGERCATGTAAVVVDAAGASAVGVASAGWVGAAWRLTTGIEGDVPLGTRRMPPDTGIDSGATPAAAASAAAAARCTAAGRAALAAVVSGRSGMWIAWRETVGMLRIGGATGSAGAAGAAGAVEVTTVDGASGDADGTGACVTIIEASGTGAA
jgi:hypothetical protein